MPKSQILTSQKCFLTLIAYISEFKVVCVVTDVLYMCLIHVKGIKKILKNKEKEKNKT